MTTPAVKTNTATLIHVNNPFDVADQTRDVLHIRDGVKVGDLINADFREDHAVSVNGRLLELEEWDSSPVYEGDYVVLCPVPTGGGGSKSVLRVVALVAVSVLSGGIGGALAGHFGLSAAWGYAIGAGLSIAGSMMVNALMPIETSLPQTANSLEKDSPSYGLDGPKNTQREGVVVPVVYGRYRVGGNIIAVHTLNRRSGKNQDLRVLMALSEGTIGGIDFSTLEINDQPYDNFSNIALAGRLGHKNQKVISWFNDNITPQSVGVTLSTSFHTYTTTKAVSKFRVDLVAPQGFRKINDQGESRYLKEEFDIQYRVKDSGSSWKTVSSYEYISHYTYEYHYFVDAFGNVLDEPLITSEPAGWGEVQPNHMIKGDMLSYISGSRKEQERNERDGYTDEYIGMWYKYPVYSSTPKIKAKSASSYRLSFESETLPTDFYEIRVRRKGAESTNSQIVDKLVWADLNEINVSDVAYRHTALAAVNVRMTDQIHAIPKVTVEVEGVRVRMPKGDYRVGEPWTRRTSSNPAWVALDMLTNSRYGAGYADNRIDMYAWMKWASYCQEQGLRFNGVYDASMNFWDALGHVMRCGHAKIVPQGIRLSVAIERADFPVMAFNVSNMKKASLSINWLPMSDRANEIDVTYYDKDNHYKPTKLRVVDPDAQQGKTPRTVELNLIGKVTAAEARKEANLLLNLNKYVQQTVTFEAPVEAIACKVGDLVYLQHDIPKWGDGGRTAMGSTDTVIKLDRPVTMESGKSYALMLNFDYLQVASGVTQEGVNAYSIFLDTTYQKEGSHRLMLGGEEYTVRSITEAPDGRMWVHTVEPMVDTSADQPYELYRLDALEECPVQTVAGEATEVTLTTPMPMAPGAYVKWLFGETVKGKKPFRVMAIDGEGVDERTITAMEYWDQVYTEDRVIAEPPNHSQLPKGEQVTDLVAEQVTKVIGGISTPLVLLSWDAPESYSGAEIFVRRDADGDYRPVGVVRDGETSFEYTDLLIGETLYFKVAAVDRVGGRAAVSSAPEAFVTITKSGNVLSAPALTSCEYTRNGILLRWDNPDADNFVATEVFRSTTDDVNTATRVYRGAGTGYEDRLVTAPSYFYWLRAVNSDNIEGPFSASSASPAALPQTTGLALKSPFVGRSAEIQWDREPGAHHYEVEVHTKNTLRRTDTVGIHHYSYSIEDALADGDVDRDITFVVRAVTVNDQASPTATLAVNNPAPGLPESLSILAGFKTIVANFKPPADTDYTGTTLWMSTTQGFTPDDTNRVSTLRGGPITIAGLDDDTTFYIRLATSDEWGQGALSAEYSAHTQDVSELDGLSPWAYVDQVDRDFIEANINDDSIESQKIKSLTASRIVTGTLAATEKVSVEGQVESVSGPISATLGPKLIDGKVALLSAMNGTTPLFRVNEDGTAEFTGAVTISAGSGYANLADKPTDLADINSDDAARLNHTPVQSADGTLADSGWYRIAMNGGDRAAAKFTVRDRETNRHNSCQFTLGCSYNREDNATFALLMASRYYMRTIQKIRLLTKDTHDAMYVDVYINDPNNQANGYECVIEDNFQVNGWTIVDFQPATVPTDYTVTEYLIDTNLVADNTGANTALDTAYVNSVPSVQITADLQQALDDAAAAQATADGKINSFYQTSEPTSGMFEGDLWFDVDDGRRIYRFDGTNWVDAQDSQIGQALNDASNAQATADGKVTSFLQSTTPTAEALGDLWYNPTTKLLKRWDGSAWVTTGNAYTNTSELTDDASLGQTAVWGSVTGSGKPQDNADVTAENTAADTVAVGGAPTDVVLQKLASARALGILTDHVNVFGESTVYYSALENGTDIYQNGQRVVTGATAGTNGTLSSVAGDVFEANRPVHFRTFADQLPCVALAAYEFVFVSTRYPSQTFHIYAPFADAEVRYTFDSQDFDNPNQTIICPAGQVVTFTGADLDETSHDHRIRSSAPILVAKEGNGGDRMWVKPADRELIFRNAQNTRFHTAYSATNKIWAPNGSVYSTSESRHSFTDLADGDGSDMDMSVPVDALGDTYLLGHAIADYILAAVEPTLITVEYWDGTQWVMFNQHDFTNASRSNPMDAVVGAVDGGDPDFASGAYPWRFQGTGRFYLRTNSDGAREYSVIGYWSLLRNRFVNRLDGDFDALQLLNGPADAGATLGADWDSNVTNKPMTFRVIATGYSATSHPQSRGLRDEQGVPIAQAGRSYMVSVMDRATQTWDSHSQFDVYYSPTDVIAMRDLLDGLDSSKIVIIHTHDEPKDNRLTNNLPEAMYRCGASRSVFGSARFKKRGAYILVGIPDIGEGNGMEFYAGEIDSDPNAWVETNVVINKGNVQLGGFRSSSALDISYADGTTIEDWKPADMGATAGATWDSDIDGQPSDSKLYNNLLDASQWVIGAQGTQGEFGQYGGDVENEIILGVGPFGNVEPIWHGISDGQGGWCGGYDARVPIDHTKSYRHTVWVKRENGEGATYFGCRHNETAHLDGTVEGDPYHIGGHDPDTLGKWYLYVGIIHGSGYDGGETGLCGMYDPVTGLKVRDGQEFKNLTSTVEQAQRIGLYDDPSATGEIWIARPRLEQINGNEIPLETLMARAADVNSVNGVPATQITADIQQALDDASAAQSTADGKIQSFYQASAPTSGMSLGDLWFDTDDGNKVHRYDGSSWVDAQDSQIGQALGDAATAQATADGKVTTFFQAATPTAEGVGDLWYSEDNRTLKRWNGSSWENAASYSDANEAVMSGSSLIKNGDFTMVAADGRPAGVKAAYAYPSPSNISYADAAKTILKVHHDTNEQIGAALPAFRVNPGTKYGIFIRVKASEPKPSGFYFRIEELDTELPIGYTHISHHSSASEEGVTEDTRQIQFLTNTDIGDTWEEWYWEYTPTSTAKWASPLFLNWLGMNTAELHVDVCHVFELSTYGADWDTTIAGRPADHELLNYEVSDNTTYIAKPQGGQGRFFGNEAQNVGFIKITLPVLWTNSMSRFRFDAYTYKGNSAFSLELGGYNYDDGGNGNPRWVNTAAKISGHAVANHPVRFGHDGSNVCIWIGEANSEWPYFYYAIRDLVTSGNYSAWATGWNVELVTALDTVQFTRTDVLGASDDTLNVNGVPSVQITADLQQALDDAAAAQSTADGKITAFYQASAPGTGVASGDLWFDTDDGNKVYRYDGSSWVSADDSRIAQAINDAQTAQTTADGKAQTFFQTTAPSGASAGDLWYNSNDKLLKRYNGSSWDVTGNTATNTSDLTDDAGLGQSADWSGVTNIPDRLGDSATVGLNLTASYMGYYDGSQWGSYIANDGSFFFGDAAAGQYLSFDPGAGVMSLGPKTNIGSNADRAVTVGSGGDYTTINDALEALSRTVPAYKQGGFTATITLLTGFVMAEQIIVSNVELGWIRVVSDDAEVSVDPAAITANVENSLYPPVISAVKGGRTPVFDCQFKFDAFESELCGVYSENAGSVVRFGTGGFNNARINIHATQLGEVTAENLTAKFALTGGYITFGGIISIDNDGTFTDNYQASFGVGYGIYISNSGTVRCGNNLTLDNCGYGMYSSGGFIHVGDTISADNNDSYGFYLNEGTEVSCTSLTADNCSTTGVYARKASKVSVHSTTLCRDCDRGVDLNSADFICGGNITATGNAYHGVRVRYRSRLTAGTIYGKRSDGVARTTDCSIAASSLIQVSTINGGQTQSSNTITNAGLIMGG